MKVHKSIMHRNQIELSGFESIEDRLNITAKLTERDDVVRVAVHINGDVVIICKPGKREAIYRTLV